MIRADGWIVAFTADAFGPVRVVAYPNKTTAPIACIGEAVGARSEDGLVVVARAAVELIEVVTVFLMRQGPLSGLAVRLVV